MLLPLKTKNPAPPQKMKVLSISPNTIKFQHVNSKAADEPDLVSDQVRNVSSKAADKPHLVLAKWEMLVAKLQTSLTWSQTK